MFNIFLFNEYIFSINGLGSIIPGPLSKGLDVFIENHHNNLFITMDDLMKFFPPCKYIQLGPWVYYPQAQIFLTNKKKVLLGIYTNDYQNINHINMVTWFWHLLKYSNNNQILFKMIIIAFLFFGIIKELWIYG